MKKITEFLKAHPAFTGFFALAVDFVAIKVLNPQGNIYGMALLRAVLFVAMCVFVYHISGNKVFENANGKNFGYVMKWNLLVLIYVFIVAGSAIYNTIHEGTPLVDDWITRALSTLVLCFFVGLLEEIVFRVALNEGLLYAFRNAKHIFLWSAIISSLIFGVVHVLGANMGSSDAIASAALKTISTAMGGLFWLILYWKTRNLFAIAMCHGIYDFIPMVINNVTEKQVEIGGANVYASGNIGEIVVYSLEIILMFIFLPILWHKVGKKIDFEEIRKTW